MTGVAVVVGNHQGEAVLDDCLASLAEQVPPPDEVVVVDAESTDASAEIAARRGARWIATTNRGLGHLYNVGARATEAELVLLANNDVALEPRCLELLARTLRDDPTLFAADPTQLDWNGSRLVHAQAVLRRGPLLRTLLPGFDLDMTVPAEEPVRTVSANGGVMLVRRERLLELGGFDETFFMDYEDLDLCWRAGLRGWSSVYVPDAVVRHRVGAVTHSGVLTRRLRSSHHNLVRFALKCLPPAAAARVVAGELLRLPRHPHLVAPALAQVARELPEIVRLRRAVRPRRDFLERHLEAGRRAA